MKIMGIDAAFSNIGLALAEFDEKNVKVLDLHLIKTEGLKKRPKGVPRSSSSVLPLLAKGRLLLLMCVLIRVIISNFVFVFLCFSLFLFLQHSLRDYCILGLLLLLMCVLITVIISNFVFVFLCFSLFLFLQHSLRDYCILRLQHWSC